MKTVIQALISKVHWPIPEEFAETVCIERQLDKDAAFDYAMSQDSKFKGAMADCLYSLAQAINFSEAGKSVGNLTDEQRRLMLRRANALYKDIGEEEKETGAPTVYFGG